MILAALSSWSSRIYMIKFWVACLFPGGTLILPEILTIFSFSTQIIYMNISECVPVDFVLLGESSDALFQFLCLQLY